MKAKRQASLISIDTHNVSFPFSQVFEKYKYHFNPTVINFILDYQHILRVRQATNEKKKYFKSVCMMTVNF